MKPLALLEPPTEFEDFTFRFIRCFYKSSITMELKPSLARTMYQVSVCIMGVMVVTLIMAFLLSGCGTLSENFAAVTPLNYWSVGVGKIFCSLYFRLSLIGCLEDIKQISPSVFEIQQHGLENYLRVYRIVANLSYFPLKYLLTFMTLQPMVQSFILLWLEGEFGYIMPVSMWPLVPKENGYFLYGFYYFLFAWGTYCYAAVNMAVDLGFISCLCQLSIHFELISKYILELQPENDDCLESLTKIIRKHQHVLSLTRKVNTIFAPSIGLALLSSSFIICFVAYQMTVSDDPIEVIKSFLSLIYEVKQSAVICLYGDKLIETSARVFDAIYMHDWYNGSVKYQRQVGIFLMATRDPATIRIIGSVDVSSITLKQVLSNAYQIFAVLKSV